MSVPLVFLRTRAIRNFAGSPIFKEYSFSGFAGCVLYLSYSHLGNHWRSGPLIAVSLYFFLSVPLYARFSNWIDAWAAARASSLTTGRIARFLAQYAYNLGMYFYFLEMGIVSTAAVGAVGGPMVGALLTTLSSNGMQYVALWLAQRGIGDDVWNVIIAVCATIFVTAITVFGVPMARELFITIGTTTAITIFLFGLINETRTVRFGGFGK